MRVHGDVIGALNLFGAAGQAALGVPTARVAQAMADVASVTIAQGRLAHERVTLIDQLETALESPLAIEQAKGMVARHLDVSLEEAFGLLRGRGRRSRRLLRDVARDAIDNHGRDYSTDGH